MRKAISVLLVLICFWALSGEAAQDKNTETKHKAFRKERPLIIVLRQQTIVSANPETNELRIKGKDGAEQKIVIAPETKIKKRGKNIALSGISAGDAVTVYFKPSKDGQKIPSTVKVMNKERRKAKPI